MKKNKLVVYGLSLLCVATQLSLEAHGGGGGHGGGGHGGGHGGFGGGGHSAGFGGRGGSGRAGRAGHSSGGHHEGHGGGGYNGHGRGYSHGGYGYGGFYGWGWGFGAGFLLADLSLSRPTQTIIIENMDTNDLKKATQDLQERSNKQAVYIQELESKIQKFEASQKVSKEDVKD